MRATTLEQYEGQRLDDAVDLLARIRHLGLLTAEAEQTSDIAGDVDAFIEMADECGTIGAAPRCDTCGRVLDIESWDTPVLYCRFGCE